MVNGCLIFMYYICLLIGTNMAISIIDDWTYSDFLGSFVLDVGASAIIYCQ